MRKKHKRQLYRLEIKKSNIPNDPIYTMTRNGVALKTAYRYLWAIERKEGHTQLFWLRVKKSLFPYDGADDFFGEHLREAK